MVVAILYGAYDFFIVPGTKSVSSDAGKKPAELAAFAADVTANMTKESLSTADAYAINRAETEWTQNLFMNSKDFNKWTEAKNIKTRGDGSAVAKTKFIYSGYIGMGSKWIAIINGVEYKEGDALDVAGFVLKSISPEKVVIEISETGTKLIIPMQD